MSDPNDMRDGLKLTDRATLSLLSALENNEPVTQRGLSKHIGIALGLTNTLLKRAVHKGLVKMYQAPAKRYAYYITPKGFGEKSRLVAEYLTSSLAFFRQARGEYTSAYKKIQAKGHQRIALFGAGELAEIAALSALEDGIELHSVIQLGSNVSQFSNIPVINSIETAMEAELDAVIITNSDAPQEAYEALREHFDDERIFSVPLLHITRDSAKGAFDE